MLVAACGGDDGGSDTDPDPDPVLIDAGSDDTVDAAPLACTVSTESFGDKGALTGGAIFDGGDLAGDATDDVLEFAAVLEASQPADAISVLLYADYGVFAGGAITPGTYEITGEELNFATCGVCVMLVTNATPEGYEDDYMATGGTVTITAAGTGVGMNMTGTLTSVTFGHVDIDPSSGETTPASACMTAMSNATFDGTLEAPQ